MPEQVETVDDYLRRLPDDVQEILERLRRVLLTAVPRSGETISYRMPTVLMDGAPLLYYAGWKKHAGMYPVPFGDAGYEALVGPYRAAKDSVNFPYRKPMPWPLVDRIVELMIERRAAG